MEDLIKVLNSPQKTNHIKSKRKKKKRYPFLPYDPALGDSEQMLDISKELQIIPGQISGSNNGKLSSTVFLDKIKGNKSAGSKLKSNEIEKIRHLFSRASFGTTPDEMAGLSTMAVEEIVNSFFEQPAPEPPGEWVTEPFDFRTYRRLSDQERQEFQMENRRRINETRQWWLSLMMASPINFGEKMTLFWHGHFTSDAQSAALAQFSFKQNDTLRTFAMGNFRNFVKTIYKDPAMLLYLDGVSNISEQPNENFARELMELFTMGVGNYTENDIKEAARAFTGWQLDTINLTSFFNPTLHDFGSKTFLGQTGNFDGDDIVEIILQQDVTATYICRTFYEFLVSREVDEPFVDEMANIFRSSDYEIRPVLEFLLKDDRFYSETAVASLIKGPVELSVSNARMLTSERVNLRFLLAVQELLGQALLYPPNVAGWPGQRNWISPTTYVTRNTFNEIYVNPGLFIDRETDRPAIEFDPIKYAQSFGIEGARDLAQAISDHLLRIPINEKTMDFLLTVLIGTADENDWSLNYPGADRLVTAFITQIVRLPEFHLS